jgi:hypothetical protein
VHLAQLDDGKQTWRELSFDIGTRLLHKNKQSRNLEDSPKQWRTRRSRVLAQTGSGMWSAPGQRVYLTFNQACQFYNLPLKEWHKYKKAHIAWIFKTSLLWKQEWSVSLPLEKWAGKCRALLKHRVWKHKEGVEVSLDIQGHRKRCPWFQNGIAKPIVKVNYLLIYQKMQKIFKFFKLT